MRVTLCVTLLAGCAPPACSDAAERSLARDARALIVDDGPVAVAAGKRLIVAGHPAIVHLETALYEADAAARLRVIGVFKGLADSSARPVLEHLARTDADPDVRQAAAAAAAGLRAR